MNQQQTIPNSSNGNSAAAGISHTSDQTDLDTSDLLHSANSGVIIHRTAVVKTEFREQALELALDVASYINSNYRGMASAFVYEQAFGSKDTMHWLIHCADLGTYAQLARGSRNDADYRALLVQPRNGASCSWSTVFVDGSLREAVLLPQFYGMYGTATDTNKVPVRETSEGGMILPSADNQTSIANDKILHSANCGLVIHRQGQLKFKFRAEGREFSRAVAEIINTHQQGVASVFLYEEAFGRSDRVHWLIHLKDLSAYYSLIDMRAAMDPEVADVYSRLWISEEKGGGDWSRMFIDATLEDTALVPEHWHLSATMK